MHNRSFESVTDSKSLNPARVFPCGIFVPPSGFCIARYMLTTFQHTWRAQRSKWLGGMMGHGEGHQRTAAAVLKSMGKECFTQTVSSFKSYEARGHALNWQILAALLSCRAEVEWWYADIYIYIERESQYWHTFSDVEWHHKQRNWNLWWQWGNCRLNLPQRKQRIADLLIYFQCRQIQALIYVCQCGDLRRCRTCAEMLLLQSLASFIFSGRV